MTRRALFAAVCLLAAPVWAQETATPNGVRDVRAGAVALTGVAVQVDPDRRIEDATLLVREGRVVGVREGRSVPEGYVEQPLPGRIVFPAFVDLDSAYGLPAPEARKPFSFAAAEVLASPTPGAFNVNQAIRSEYSAADSFAVDAERAMAYRRLGFGAVLTYRADGIARGSGALVTTATDTAAEVLLVPEASAHFSFDKGSSTQSYPISPMGSIALLRQTDLDATWYGGQTPRPFTDLTLEAWLRHRALPRIFAVDGWQALLRADEVGDEMGVQLLIRGVGDEYRRLDAVRATGAGLIVPIEFPGPSEVEDPLEAERLTLSELKHWELAPSNPGRLATAGVPLALTSGGREGFWKDLRKAIQHGLSERDALAALTLTPARMLGVEDRLGSLRDGAVANFLVASGEIFAEDTVLEETWVQGRRYRLAEHPADRRGTYRLEIAGLEPIDLEISGKPGKPEASIPAPTAEIAAGALPSAEDAVTASPSAAVEPTTGKVEVGFDGELVRLAFSTAPDAPAVRLSGWMAEDRWQGRGQLGDGRWVDWSATRIAAAPAEAGDLAMSEAEAGSAEEATPTAARGPIVYPFTAFGWTEPPTAVDLLIRNATVWTNEAEGVLAGADVLVRDGRIAAVGRGLEGGSARVIDAAGMHLTPGIIDEHSHLALSGVNDVATNSGMVRMADVVDSEDIDIYRNLAGGVTAAQLLHGSANPIGGQSALVKMRWGALPREMLIEGADGFIKFALGENVKRSRSQASIRYPGTRMGVEQVYRDAFSAAEDYRSRRRAWESGGGSASGSLAPRRDLALETMVEILEGRRFITCHSYVQSEINMLMHLAEDFGFRVNTFTHILEGYKVADKMAAHGAGGSSFSDWWAYKWEVRYAIPYNAALMSEAGVTVAINSDSAEMSRRLNQEAAKAVKYGGLPEEEALKLVTLNPARLLHLDGRMGSIRAGKDADLVLWTDHPLSIYAVADKTLVDGAIYYDREADRKAREELAAERARLLEAMRREDASASGGGAGAGGPSSGPPRLWQCDSLHGYEYLGFEVGN